MSKKKNAEQDTTGDVPVAATKAPGGAAGKTDSVKAATPPAPQTKSMKIPKLAGKHKSRLPRRQKKALRKGSPGKG